MLAAVAIAGMAKVWDLISGACLHTFGTRDVEKVVFSPNSIQLALVTSGDVEIWDLMTGTRLKTMDDCFVESVSFSADGTHLALINHSIIKIHDLAANVDLQTHTSHVDETFRAVIFPSDYAQLKSGFSDDIVGPRSTGTDIGASVLTDGAFHTTLVVLAQTRSTFKLLDLATGKCTQTLAVGLGLGNKQLNEMALSSDGMRLALRARYEDTTSIWDLATGKCIQTLEDHTRVECKAMVFSADGLRLALAKDGIQIWDIATGTCLQTFQGHTDSVASLAYSPDGMRLVSGAGDGTVKVWDLAAHSSPQLKRNLLCERGICTVTFSPNGKWVALGLDDETVRIWDTATRTVLRTIKMRDWVDVVAFSPDSTQLATAEGLDGIINLWDAATGAQLRALTGRISIVVSIAFSPNSTQLASGSDDGSLKIWDLTAATCLHTLGVDGYVPLTIAFSPGGTQLGVISMRGTVKIWDPFTGKCLHEKSLDPKIWNYWGSYWYHHERMEILFASFSQEQHSYYSYKAPELSLSEDKTWILHRQNPMLWLPQDYRPKLIEIHENRLVIVTENEDFLYFEFCFDDLEILS